MNCDWDDGLFRSKSVASLTIRNIDDELKERLRVRAAQQGHSMDEEARIILWRTVGGISGGDLWSLSEQTRR